MPHNLVLGKKKKKKKTTTTHTQTTTSIACTAAKMTEDDIVERVNRPRTEVENDDEDDDDEPHGLPPVRGTDAKKAFTTLYRYPRREAGDF